MFRTSGSQIRSARLSLHRPAQAFATLPADQPVRQTTSNACATVALLNIVMNADVGLGERLQDFKERTKDLHSALRGHFLSANQFISTIHNSFARRMDHLNADLWLENEASSAASSRSRRSTAPKKARGISKKNKGHIEYGFHFIAYVPKNGRVWELDGLRAKPRPIGNSIL